MLWLMILILRIVVFRKARVCLERLEVKFQNGKEPSCPGFGFPCFLVDEMIQEAVDKQFFQRQMTLRLDVK